MPCHDPFSDADTIRDLVGKVNKLTRMLCETCRYLEEKKVGAPSEEVLYWWIAHQKADAERRFMEDNRRRDQELRAQVLAKLTQEEKAVLGL